MANTLTTAEKALILDGNDVGLGAGSYSATSSDPTVASIGGDGGLFIVIGQTAGTATITATRNADGAEATMEVTVTGGAPFTIHLGTPVPK